MSANVIRRTGRKGWFVSIFDVQLSGGRKLLKGGATKEAAKAKARKVEELQEKGVPAADILARVFSLKADRHPTESLADAARAFIEWRETEARVRASTLAREKKIVNHLVGHDWTAKPVDSVRVADIAAYVRDRRKAELNFGTIQRHLSLLSQLFEWASRERRVALGFNPVRDARAQHRREWRDEKNEVGHYLTEDEFQALLTAADEHAPHLRPAIIVAVHTLIRRGEMLNLQWHDVEMKTGHMVVRAEIAKNGTARTVPINSTVSTALRGLKKNRVVPMTGPDAVFGHIGDERFRADWLRVRAAAGLAKVRWHDLRHSGCAFLLRAGVAPGEVQRIGGWKCSSMMDRYSRFVPSVGSTNALDKLALG